MHPQLTLLNNAMCAEYIDALKRCHEEGGVWARLIGACNGEKAALDACFREQKKVKRSANLLKARADRERWLSACAELERSGRGEGDGGT